MFQSRKPLMHLKKSSAFSWILMALCLVILKSCTKDHINVITDNDPISVTNISRLKIENYVNRLFIDLIGREPLKVELGPEVDSLKAKELSREARLELINKLMQDTTFRIGERSYKAAFYLNLYNLAKVRCLEGVSDEEIQREMGLLISDAMRDSMDGKWDRFYSRLNQIRKLQVLLQSQVDLYNQDINYHQVFSYLVDNSIYDVINMNTFNFIRAVYNELLFRLPTDQEYNVAFEVIEKNQPGIIFGNYCSNRTEFIQSMIESPAMFEGMVIWIFQIYLNRFPKERELATILPEYITHRDIREIIRKIAVTDEYASFK
ncbi:MAG: hypothetical protein K1X68_06525 [Saprospiraceae bacterium]|nr:hypothetical protein [Saprospiraceae bacterium]HMW38334.1 hypothetical protein [Saprospiraceae bacterium]HMX88176.1 hypothetical protein [Saprospiraceae bacterium]HMZ39915.1 hypothetical protein [Saprospiraceae bacterium]HNB29573.1 hypothetical protein [Saprospiraceae bacterium]